MPILPDAKLAPRAQSSWSIVGQLVTGSTIRPDAIADLVWGAPVIAAFPFAGPNDCRASCART